VGSKAFRDLSGHLAQDGVHGCKMDRDVGMLDRPGVEQRHHQIDRVVLALDVELGCVCQQSQTP
jgi:hypothetical protein